MLEAGMDLKKAFDVLVSQQKKEGDKALLLQLRTFLLKGASLSESMEKSDVFTAYEYYCVQIGEESGQQLKVLSELAQFYTNKLRVKKQLMKSLSYPMVILLASVGAVSFMLSFIVPMFSDIFNRFNGDLPMITQFFIRLSSLLSDYFWIILLILLSFVTGVAFLLKKKLYKQKLQMFYAKIPYVGGIITGVFSARLCASMSLLIGARVPLVNAIQLVCKMIDFYPIQRALKRVEVDVMRGSSFYESLAKQHLLDEKSLSLIQIGEEVNKLEVFFEKLNQRFTDEVDVKTTALNTFLEPVIIMVLGIVIGLILVAMYLPMFKLSTSMGM